MIREYNFKDRGKWDEIVRSFEKYDVYYLWEYVHAFQLHGDGEPILIYFEKDNTRAINVVMKRDIAQIPCFGEKIRQNEWFDLATPYGYGGFIVEGDDYNSLEREYESYGKEKHIISEFVRFHPLLDNSKGLEQLYETQVLGKTVSIDLNDQEEIWNNLTSKNRNTIRKAKKSGIEVFWSRDRRVIQPFMEIYQETMDKDHATDYYYFNREFYESILNDLKYNAMWFYAVKDNEIVAISIFMFCNGKMHYHLSASRREYQKFAPTNLLLYEAAVWGSQNGYKQLHLGGGLGAKEDSLYAFKKSFYRGEDKRFVIGKKVFNREMYKELIDLRRENDGKFDVNTTFFPQYRYS